MRNTARFSGYYSNKQLRLSFGFTLVELLIVITIIVIITGALIPSFTGYIKNQNLKQTQEQLKSDIRSIQNKALTGALSDEFINGTDPVNFWAIKFTTGSNDYDYFVSTDDTSSDCPDSIPADQYQNSDDIPSDMEIKSGSGKSCMFFNILNGDVTTTGFSSPLIFGYTGSGTSGNCRRVIFKTTGLIVSNNDLSCL